LITATAVMPLAASPALAPPFADQAQLTVHVITLDRDNVPGAVIAIEHGGGRTLLSSSDDGFATTKLPTGDYGLVVSTTGYLSARRRVQLPSAGLSTEITLSPASAISGRASFNGSPIPGVSVMAACRSEKGDRPVTVSAETDDRGEYHLSELPRRYSCTLTGRTRQVGVVVRPLNGPLPIGDTPRFLVDLSLDATRGSLAPARLTQPTDDRRVAAIRGIVVEKGTRAPVPLASIRIYDEITHSIGTAGISDAQGYFEVALAPGHYRLSASREDFDSLSPLSGAQVALPDNPQRDVLNVELPMTRGAVIAGTVRQISGQPLVGARVRVYRNRTISGRVHPVIVENSGATSTTNENGEFRLYGLSAGTYLVTASESGYEPQGSWVQYYPGGGLAAAQPVVVAASTVLDGVDIAWAPEQRSGVIQGTLRAGDGSSTDDILVTVAPSSQSSLPLSRGTRVRVDPSGHFTATGLDEGSYVVKATASSNGGVSAFGFARTLTTGDTPSDVTIITAQPRSIAGRAVTRGPDGIIRPVSDVLIGAFPVDFDEYPDGRPPVARPDEDGAFTMPLMGGPALFRIATPSSEWHVRSVSSAGADVTDIGFRATSGRSSIVVELAKQITRLSGTVKTKAGGLVVSASVVMLSSDSSRVGRWSRFTAVAKCASDGSWSYSGLPAGQYFVFAAPNVTPEEIDFEDVEWLQTYLRRAKLVTISEDSTTQLDLQSDSG
jgi:hypothetical protein